MEFLQPSWNSRLYLTILVTCIAGCAGADGKPKPKNPFKNAFVPKDGEDVFNPKSFTFAPPTDDENAFKPKSFTFAPSPDVNPKYFAKFFKPLNSAPEDNGEEWTAEATTKSPKAEGAAGSAVAAKVLDFYLKAFGCKHARIYKKFLQQYKSGEKGGFLQDNQLQLETDDKWLINRTTVSDDIDEDSTVNVQTVQTKLENIEQGQRDILANGEKIMPFPLRLFLKFVVAVGCANSNENLYSKYQEDYNKIVAQAINIRDTKNKKISIQYYFAKASCIVEQYKLES